jgi:hypothetical protein
LIYDCSSISNASLNRFVIVAYLEDGHDLPAEHLELLGVKALGAVTQRLVRLMVNLHHEAVGIGGHSCP